MFKFDPSYYSSAPIWALENILSTVDTCGNIGLTFGRDEKFLYAISRYPKSILTFLDTDSNIKW